MASEKAAAPFGAPSPRGADARVEGWVLAPTILPQVPSRGPRHASSRAASQASIARLTGSPQ